MPRAVRVRVHPLLALLLALSLLAPACGGSGSRLPAPGQYDVQRNSVRYDGERYDLFWADQGGALHELQTRSLRLVRDPERTFLEVPGSGDPILHLREDEPITVEGRDREGGFSSAWFPFFVGAAIGSSFGGGGRDTIIINQPAPGESRRYDPGTPAYRYPPTSSFGRDEDLHGSLDSSRASPPDYSKVQPAPYATSARASGSGGGNAAANKSTGAGTGASGNTSASSGQSGGSGGGSAASGKGGFANGSSASTDSGGSGASSRGGAPSTGASGGGSSGSKGIGGSGSSGGSRSSGGGRR